MKKIRIGAATGFYGDSIIPAIPSITDGNIDYLCFDALAELTMAILQKDRQKIQSGDIRKILVPLWKHFFLYALRKRLKS